MIDDKDIITKHCALGMTGSAIAETLGVSKSGVNDFLCAFKACKDLKYLSTLETHLLPSFLFNAATERISVFCNLLIKCQPFDSWIQRDENIANVVSDI